MSRGKKKMSAQYGVTYFCDRADKTRYLRPGSVGKVAFDWLLQCDLFPGVVHFVADCSQLASRE